MQHLPAVDLLLPVVFLARNQILDFLQILLVLSIALLVLVLQDQVSPIQKGRPVSIKRATKMHLLLLEFELLRVLVSLPLEPLRFSFVEAARGVELVLTVTHF